jgi:hypothetical protein
MTVGGATTIAVLTVLLAACGENRTHPMRDPYTPDPPPALACVPDLDGRIDGAELPVVVDVPLAFLVSPAGEERAIDVAGRVDGDGRRVWDLSAGAGGDQLARVAASAVESRWYADSFPGGELALPVDAAGRTEGVYVQDDAAIWLLGLASAEMDPPEGRTLLVYDEPVAVYRFPIEPGAEHVAVGETRDATLRGLPYAGRDVYEVRVDAVGRLELPDLGFDQAHRVRTRVTVEPAAGAPTSRRQVSWLFECFGEVARATSRADEPAEDFTTAAELRRLSLE